MSDTQQKKRRTPDEFAGITALVCCTACTADHCVITGIGICGHPRKGGVPSSSDAAVVGRFLRAKAALAHQAIDS